MVNCRKRKRERKNDDCHHAYMSGGKNGGISGGRPVWEKGGGYR